MNMYILKIVLIQNLVKGVTNYCGKMSSNEHHLSFTTLALFIETT